MGKREPSVFCLDEPSTRSLTGMKKWSLPVISRTIWKNSKLPMLSSLQHSVIWICLLDHRQKLGILLQVFLPHRDGSRVSWASVPELRDTDLDYARQLSGSPNNYPLKPFHWAPPGSLPLCGSSTASDNSCLYLHQSQLNLDLIRVEIVQPATVDIQRLVSIWSPFNR